MISLETLANRIETNLNLNSKGIKFRIFSDAGRFKEAIAKRTEHERFTNGVLKVVDSAVVPTQTLTVATQSVLLEVGAELTFGKDKRGIMHDHRAVLDAYFTGVHEELISEGGESYSVSMTGAVADTGEPQIRPGIGESMTWFVRINYGFIENGLNSLNCSFTLDGVTVPYSSAVITNRPQAESNPYSDGEGVGKNVVTSRIRGFDFQVPAQSAENGLSEILLMSVLREDDKIHTLTATFGTVSQTYNVVFGQTDIVLQGADNAGHNISLLEAAPSTGG